LFFGNRVSLLAIAMVFSPIILILIFNLILNFILFLNFVVNFFVGVI